MFGQEFKVLIHCSLFCVGALHLFKEDQLVLIPDCLLQLLLAGCHLIADLASSSHFLLGLLFLLAQLFYSSLFIFALFLGTYLRRCRIDMSNCVYLKGYCLWIQLLKEAMNQCFSPLLSALEGIGLISIKVGKATARHNNR